MHYERSPAYHLQVFGDLLECYHVIEPGDTQEALAVTLDRMAQVGADTRHPDGYVSLFNDGGMHITYLPETCLDVYAKLRNRQVVPKERYALQESGYYGIRQGDNLFLLDCGPIGPDYLPAHGHGDILAFEWTVGGRRIFIDTGVYEYNAGARRAYARSTCAHNTVTIDDLDQCEFWQAFRVGHRANVSVLSFQPKPGGFLFEGSHDGYHYLTGHPIHTRRVVASPRRIEVIDTITGGAGQTVRARLLCHPECRLEKTDENTLHIERDDIQIGLKTSHSMSIDKALWFPDFGISIDTHQITVHYEPAPCKGRFILEEISS